MNFLFGKKKEIPTTQSTIDKLYTTINNISKREEFLDNMISSYRKNARSCLQNNKQKAIMLLKKAKMNEKQLLSLYGQRENIEIQINTLEQSITANNTIMSLRQGKEAIVNISKNLNTDDIEELMDDISENLATSSEISDTISRPIGEIYDEEELLSEIIEIEVNELKEDNKKQECNEDKILLELNDIKINDKKEKYKESNKENKELEELRKMLSI